VHNSGAKPTANHLLRASSTAAPVVLVRASPALRPVLKGMLARHARVVWCESDTELVGWLHGCSPQLVILELRAGSSARTESLVRQIKAISGDTPVLACANVESAATGELQAAVRGGIDDLVLQDVEPIAEIERTVLAALRTSTNDGQSWFTGLAPSLHDVSVAVAAEVVAHIAAGPNLDSVARALESTTRTLQRRFETSALGPPHRLIAMVRWLCVARVLSLTGASVGEAAMATGFPNGDALRAALRRAMRIPPLELREDDHCAGLIRGILTGYGTTPIRLLSRQQDLTAARSLNFDAVLL
jgi:ActR/RegA family two-component response regulator